MLNNKIYQTPVISSWPIPVSFKEAFSDGKKRKNGKNKSSTFFHGLFNLRGKNTNDNPHSKSSILRTQTEGPRGFQKVLDKRDGILSSFLAIFKSSPNTINL